MPVFSAVREGAVKHLMLVLSPLVLPYPGLNISTINLISSKNLLECSVSLAIFFFQFSSFK